MASSKLAVFSTVHSGSLAYLDSFLDSLRDQTDREFTLWLALDEVSIEPLLLSGFARPVRCVQANGSPVQVRQQALGRLLSEGADPIVLLDSDDVADRRHVEICRAALRDESIVAVDLALWNGPGSEAQPWLSRCLAPDTRVKREDLLDANCLGGGNSALRAAALRGTLEAVPAAVAAFDWALFTRALGVVPSAKFLADVAVSYRQYPQNMAGPLDLGDGAIRRTIDIKCLHYESLRSEGSEYIERARAFAELRLRLSSNAAFAQRYFEAVRSRWENQPLLWWQAAQAPEVLGIE